MGYEENEQEIDLKEMFFNALYRWRSILLAGLVGALLLGAWKCWGIVKNRESLEKAIAEGTVTEGSYDSKYLKAKEKLQAKESERRAQSKKSTDAQKQINDAKTAISDGKAAITAQKDAIELYNGQIENTQLLLDDAQYYLDHSVLMQVAEDRPVAVRVYQISIPDIPENSYRDPADQIVSSYFKPLAGSGKFLALAQKYGMSADLMNELYSVTGNLDANQLIISATGKDQAMAEEICSLVSEEVLSQKENIKQEHQLVLYRQEFTRAKDADLVARKNAKRQEILGYKDSINTYKASIETANAAMETAERGIKNAESRIADLEIEKKEYDEKTFYLSNEVKKMEEKMPEMLPSIATRKTTIIKYALIGFVAGAAVLFVIYILIYVLKPLLRMPEDIRTVYGYPVLGVLNKKVREKLCAIDKWIMKAEGRGKRPGDDEIIKTAAVSIANTAEPGSLVAIMTTLKENQALTRVAEQLKGLVPEMKFVLLTEGVSKASNVDELSRCDAAVLLEERNATSMGKLTADVNQIRLFNKKVLGAIVL